MANYYGLKGIVTDGIVFNWDALNPQSHISGSTICRNLSASPSITGSLSGSISSNTIPGIDSTGHMLFQTTDNGTFTGTDSPRLQFTPPDTTLDKLIPDNHKQMTMEIWWKGDGNGTGGSWQVNLRVGAEVNNSADQSGHGIYLSNGGNNFQWFINSVQTGGLAVLPITKTDIGDQWHHTVMVYDGTLGSDNLHSYDNGVLTPYTDDYTDDIDRNSTYPISFGYGRDTVRFVNLYCDIIRIYTKPLTAAEALQNYNSQKSRFGL